MRTPGRTRNHGDTEMKPELDDKAALKDTGLLVYNARLLGMLLVLGSVNILLIVAAARMAYFPTDLQSLADCNPWHRSR